MDCSSAGLILQVIDLLTTISLTDLWLSAACLCLKGAVWVCVAGGRPRAASAGGFSALYLWALLYIFILLLLNKGHRLLCSLCDCSAVWVCLCVCVLMTEKNKKRGKRNRRPYSFLSFLLSVIHGLSRCSQGLILMFTDNWSPLYWFFVIYSRFILGLKQHWESKCSWKLPL